MKFFENIFSVKNIYTTDKQNFICKKKKVITILGIKISFGVKINFDYRYIANIERQINFLLYEVQRLSSSISDQKYPPPSPNGKFIPNKCILLSYQYWKCGKHGAANLGDHIQTIAVKKQLEKLFPDFNFEYFDREKIKYYDEESAFTIMQGWFDFEKYSYHNFQRNGKLIPIFIGTHYTEKAQDVILDFLNSNPFYFNDYIIGCRDKYTCEFFRNIGINSYFSRCLTLTLPKREIKNTQNKVFLVDIPKNFYKYIPSEILNNAVVINQKQYKSGMSDLYYLNSNEEFINDANNLLEKYKNEAKLIITTALHCASPCTAMGIPVVVINQNKDDRRYEVLDNIIKVYSIDELKKGQINFEPKAPDIEDLKIAMQKNLKLTIEDTFLHNVNQEELNNIRNTIENYKTYKYLL